MMKARLDLTKASPEAYAALVRVEAYLHETGLDPKLMHLLKFRASQINHCAFCLNMHSADALKAGETQQRLFVVAGWHDSPLFSAKERAALAWTEHLTNIATDGAPEPAFQDLKQHFSDREIMDLTVLIGMINLWNRLCVGLVVQHPVAA